MSGRRRAPRRAGGARRGGRRRVVPLVWTASAVAAVALALGVSGTLSAWTSAVVANDTNTVATAAAVILEEASGASTPCFSSSGTANSSTCTTINTYGGTTAPLSPGQSQQVDVTFSNVGSAGASSFKVVPGTCSQLPAANAVATPPINALCTATNELTVAVSCSPGTSYASGTAWSDLVSTPVPGSTLPTLTHTPGMAAGASATCRFSLALNANASVTDQGVVVSQPLTWTLTQ